MKSLVYATLVVGAALTVVAARPAAAQNPTPGQAQQLLQQAQQNPALAEQLRQRLRQSGRTPDLVRARLRASGYPDSLLDAYLGPGGAMGGPQRTPGAFELAAIRAVGLPPIELTQGQLPVDTGLIRARAESAQSRVFGVDVFRRSTTQFLPLLSGPVPPDYRIGSGDVLALILTGDVELAHTLQVMREGYILIPQVGQVHVANLTLEQVRDVLFSRLGRVYSGVRRTANATTRFDLSVVNVRANQIFVTGEVTQPGAYQISSLGTAMAALYAAGGVTERADMRAVAVQRGGKTVATLDLYDYLLRGDTRNDVRLETGDVVFVPTYQTRAEISGAVVRPGIYELKGGETLADLLHAAGGFRADAALKRLAVYRMLPQPSRGPGRPPPAVVDVALAADSERATTIRVPLDSGYQSERDSTGRYIGPAGLAFPDKGSPKVPLEPYDSVLIFQQPDFTSQRAVVLRGEVRYPGTYSLRAKGDRLAELIKRAGGLTPRAYAEGIRFYRATGTAGRLDIDLAHALADSGARDNVVLQPDDSIVIPEFLPSVKVLGAVNSPGSVLWRKGAGLDYYLNSAGGFAPNADKGTVSVRYANGRVRTRVHALFGRNDPKPAPGSEVFVPMKPQGLKTDILPVLATVAQMMASLVTIIVVAKR